MSPLSGNSNLPFAGISRAVLSVIYDSLHIIYSARFSDTPEHEMIASLRKAALPLTKERWAKPPTRKNPHVWQGAGQSSGTSSRRGAGATQQRIPRIGKLCIEAVARAETFSYDSSNGGRLQGVLVPSPLSILVDVLTIPEHPESSAYGFALARSLLLSHFKITLPERSQSEGWKPLTVPEIHDALESFRIYFKHRDNIHRPKSAPERDFLANFLALGKVFVLRFGTVGKMVSADGPRGAEEDCLAFLRSKQFLSSASQLEDRYEFRLATPDFVDLPDTQEILNSLLGIPLPFAGAHTVFFGGLRRSHQESAVVSVSGAPGTGKTSFALALSAVLAPFGAKCLYCTFEEDEETLMRRAESLIPTYFRRTSLLNTGKPSWLWPIGLNVSDVDSIAHFRDEYLVPLTSRLVTARDSIREAGEPTAPIVPMLVVLDGLTALFAKANSEGIDEICDFVRELLALNCLVLLLSADGIPSDSRLEYLVDTVISLRHEGTESPDTRPVRLFALAKTRLQMSRPGAHLLHLSGSRGLHLSPQLSSVLDSHKSRRAILPNTGACFDSLRPDNKSETSARGRGAAPFLVKVFPGSKILIDGHGSSGKAALALRLLMAPVLDLESLEPIQFPKHRPPRTLVVSFLYPEEYYLKLSKVLRRHTAPKAASMGSAIPPDVVAFTPSYIGPEELIERVLQELDRGRLEGAPYSGIILDGLHNTFLQFPGLQARPMVWPALYSLLGSYELTIATTFTKFSSTYQSLELLNSDDREIMLQGQVPYYHALVQATDFRLHVEPVGRDMPSRTFHIMVEGSIGQEVLSRALVWNSTSYTFGGWSVLSTLHSHAST